MALTSLRFKVWTSFLASVLAGFVTGMRTNGKERIKRTVVANLVGIVGLLVGYALAERLGGSDAADDA